MAERAAASLLPGAAGIAATRWRRALCDPRHCQYLAAVAHPVGAPVGTALGAGGAQRFAAAPDALAIVQRLAGPQVRFIELLGATETGAMAVRELDTQSNAEQPWTLLGDVTLLSPIGAPSPLEVSSPRIAREQGAAAPASRHRCDDLVLALDARRFQWLGRASSLIKVNGVRLDLARVASELSQQLHCPTLACVAVRDALRAEAFEVLFSSATLTERAVREAFTHWPAHHPRPVAVRRVAHLPLSATGKPQPWAAATSVKEYTHEPR